MNMILANLKSGGRAALVALALGAASMGATATTPAQAQPSFHFDFGIAGGSSTFSFGLGRDGVRIKRACLTNNEIRRGLRRAGFEQIRFLDRRGNRVRVIAEWDANNRDYSMRINRCTGRVSDIEPVRRRGGGSGGFGLQFQFGN